jgi:multicomponent Na+:H+ antiporter subunit F
VIEFTVFNVVTGIALLVQTSAALLCVAKIATSRDLATRIVALDLLLAVILGAVAIISARSGVTAYLDVLVVGSLVVFIGSVLASRLLDGDAGR